MITAAYTAKGRQISLPTTGRVRLPAGTIVQKGAEFRTLDKDSLMIRGSEWNGLTQATKYHEQLKEIAK